MGFGNRLLWKPAINPAAVAYGLKMDGFTFDAGTTVIRTAPHCIE